MPQWSPLLMILLQWDASQQGWSENYLVHWSTCSFSLVAGKESSELWAPWAAPGLQFKLGSTQAQQRQSVCRDATPNVWYHSRHSHTVKESLPSLRGLLRRCRLPSVLVSNTSEHPQSHPPMNSISSEELYNLTFTEEGSTFSSRDSQCGSKWWVFLSKSFEWKLGAFQTHLTLCPDSMTSPMNPLRTNGQELWLYIPEYDRSKNCWAMILLARRMNWSIWGPRNHCSRAESLGNSCILGIQPGVLS